MSIELPDDYEKQRTLKISTCGRKTGRPHQVTIQFAVDSDGRIFIATRSAQRDWVRNVIKNPSGEVTIAGVTQKMKAFPLTSDDDKQHQTELYRKKYLALKLYSLAAPRYRAPQSFELKPE